jgi:hypothetical protein
MFALLTPLGLNKIFLISAAAQLSVHFLNYKVELFSAKSFVFNY